MVSVDGTYKVLERMSKERTNIRKIIFDMDNYSFSYVPIDCIVNRSRPKLNVSEFAIIEVSHRFWIMRPFEASRSWRVM